MTRGRVNEESFFLGGLDWRGRSVANKKRAEEERY